MLTWWQGTRLIALRGIVETVRSKAFRIVAALLLTASVGAVVLPQLLGGGPTTYTLATIGPAPHDVAAALDAAGTAGGFTVSYLTGQDEPAVREAVRTGEADAGVAGQTLYAAAKGAGPFPVVVSQTLVGLETERRMLAAGLSAEQVATLQSIRPPQQVTVGAVQDEGRAAAGFTAGIVLYMALTFAGSMVANAVAMEKSTRISEVLLAVVRPSQVLMGTVLSVGATTLAQLLILATPVVVASRVTDGGVALPAATGVDLALAVSWFLLGFVLYAVAFAAAAALVDKITEVSAAITPVTVVLVLSYLGGIVIATRDTEDALSVLISLFPFSAPVAMPIRWASGEVPGYQLVLAMALTAATAVLMVRIASSFYRKALLITGHRVRLSEIWRRSGRERADDVGPRGAV